MVAASGKVPPVKRFGQGDDIRLHTGNLACEHRIAQPRKADKNLVKDQEQIMRISQTAQGLQRERIVEDHAARALHQRFHNDSGQFTAMPRPANRPAPPLGPALRGRSTTSCSSSAPLNRLCMPSSGIAHAHRGESIAVVAAAKAQEFDAALAAG